MCGVFLHKMKGVHDHTGAQRAAGMTQRRATASLSAWPMYSEVILGVSQALPQPLGQSRLAEVLALSVNAVPGQTAHPDLEE